jgi:predicted transposase YdaD
MGLHDSLVAHAFADVEHARGVLASALPPAIAARVDFSSLRPEKGSFVDEHLQGRATDLLYSARIGGREALIYFLWEHKSEPERLAPLQVLRYLVRIWDQYLAALPVQRRGEIRRLPVIVPVVIHHGEDGWTTAVRFEELLDADEDMLAALGEHVPRLTLVLDDLWKQTDDALYARAATAFARLVLWALKHARGARWFADEERWKDLIATVLAEPDGVRALTALFRYIAQASPAATRERLRGLLPSDGFAEAKEAVMNEFQQEIADGERRGRAEGLREGKRDEAQRLVLKQLRLRFGELPDAAVSRIQAAELQELELWAERIVTASRLEDVLGPAAG